MAGRGRSKVELVLSDDERATLLRWERRAKPAQALALRCRIVLACAEGLSNTEVAERLGRGRFSEGDGDCAEPGPHRRPTGALTRATWPTFARVALCLDVSIDGLYASLVAAAMHPDNPVCVEPWEGRLNAGTA
ncbi:hypothetical protein [Amycolatopsis sp. CA-126428]|uniref:hypothetical protein n=1 Tax=Amycolatopsis sp. CA-126428 TaxID=2073158 RepID=UPI0035194EC4